jgi:hypothetical protein
VATTEGSLTPLGRNVSDCTSRHLTPLSWSFKRPYTIGSRRSRYRGFPCRGRACHCCTRIDDPASRADADRGGPDTPFQAESARPRGRPSPASGSSARALPSERSGASAIDAAPRPRRRAARMMSHGGGVTGCSPAFCPVMSVVMPITWLPSTRIRFHVIARDPFRQQWRQAACLRVPGGLRSDSYGSQAGANSGPPNRVAAGNGNADSSQCRGESRTSTGGYELVPSALPQRGTPCFLLRMQGPWRVSCYGLMHATGSRPGVRVFRTAVGNGQPPMAARGTPSHLVPSNVLRAPRA